MLPTADCDGSDARFGETQFVLGVSTGHAASMSLSVPYCYDGTDELKEKLT